MLKAIVPRLSVAGDSIASLRRFATTSPRRLAPPDQLSFPCLDRNQRKTQSLMGQGPEPIYSQVQSGFQLYHSKSPLFLDYGGHIPEFTLAYESWGKLNKDRSNALLLHTGLSASSHAHSHEANSKQGWWEQFIGPGKPLDTNKYFIICTNVLGGCYGSTGPSSVHPADNQRYATRFPIISVSDMVRAQHRLITEHLKISKLYASVGSSLGGMQSFAYLLEFPETVEKVVSISACTRSHPASIAMRFSQRQIVMHDPNWASKRGNYYDLIPPHTGMKLARSVATITYRSGPEWELRFARARLQEHYRPALCPDFLVETYLDHQGDKFSLEFDPNSFLYVLKAMDLFDLGYINRSRAARARAQAEEAYNTERPISNAMAEFKTMDGVSECLSIPKANEKNPYANATLYTLHSHESSLEDLRKGLSHLRNKKVLVIGVKSDILFPVWQQREAYEMFKDVEAEVKYEELGEDISMFGHDTFLLDVEHIGLPISKFLG